MYRETKTVQRNRDTSRETETGPERQSQAHRDREMSRETDKAQRVKDRPRETETRPERQRHVQRDKDRSRETETSTERQRRVQRDRDEYRETGVQATKGWDVWLYFRRLFFVLVRLCTYVCK